VALLTYVRSRVSSDLVLKHRKGFLMVYRPYGWVVICQLSAQQIPVFKCPILCSDSIFTRFRQLVAIHNYREFAYLEFLLLLCRTINGSICYLPQPNVICQPPLPGTAMFSRATTMSRSTSGKCTLSLGCPGMS